MAVLQLFFFRAIRLIAFLHNKFLPSVREAGFGCANTVCQGAARAAAVRQEL